MKYLNVWLTFPDASKIICGELAYPEKREPGQPGSAFRYTSDYLAHPNAFALDPLMLPLSDREYFCERSPEDIHPVFEDSLPDSWGMRLLAKRARTTVSQTRLADLLELLAGNGIGALSYREKGDPDKPYDANITELEQLVKVAHDVEEGIESDSPELSMLFGVGSSPPGARPKVLVKDQHTQWLAKMPSKKDTFSIVPLECATLDVAEIAGLNIPEHKIVQCGQYQVLLIKRFDVRESGGRVHLVTMKTILRESFYHRYDELAEVIRRLSDEPAHDLEHMFRHMVFNALIGNTDDHTKNFSMQHSENGWQLTQAYDLLPNTGDNPEHALSFAGSAYPPSFETLAKLGRGPFTLSSQKTNLIIQQVILAVSNWKAIYQNYDIPDREIRVFEKDIAKRLLK